MDKKKILIVDDDEDTLLVIEKILSGADYKIFRAKSGKECIEQAEKIFPDVIVMDIMMPGLDGIATVLKLKATEKVSSIPIIICTAVREGEDEIVARNLGVVDYVRKTSNMEGLVAKIKKVLNK